MNPLCITITNIHHCSYFDVSTIYTKPYDSGKNNIMIYECLCKLYDKTNPLEIINDWPQNRLFFLSTIMITFRLHKSYMFLSQPPQWPIQNRNTTAFWMCDNINPILIIYRFCYKKFLYIIRTIRHKKKKEKHYKEIYDNCDNSVTKFKRNAFHKNVNNLHSTYILLYVVISYDVILLSS